MPLRLSRGSIVGRQESAHSRITAGCADDHFIFDDKRSTGRAIVLHFVRVLHVPDQASRAGVQAEQVGIVGFGIDKVLPDGHPTVYVGCGVVQQSRTYGTTVMPQTPS